MLIAKGPKAAQNDSRAIDRIVFVGSSIVFPDMMLRLVEAEFEGIGVERLGSVAQTDPAEPMPSLVIVDERFADEIEHGLAHIRQCFAGADVVLAYHDPATARRLLELQQSDKRLDGLRFVPMNASLTGWMSMLHIFLTGAVVVPGDLLSHHGAEAPEPRQAKPGPSPEVSATLTDRECEVLDRVARGYRNKAVAAELGLSEHTVKLHIHHIITKLEVDNRTAAANWYLARHGNNGPTPTP